jgi:hypothetical protein
VPSISGDAAIDVAIGLAFFFFLLSIVCSSVNEAIAAVFKLRAGTLEGGIRGLIADKAKADAFYNHWRMKTLFTQTVFRREKKPSYIPSNVFAMTLLDTFAPPAAKTTSDDLIGRAQAAVASMEAAATSGAPEIEQKVLVMLKDALDQAGTDRDKFRLALETAFNQVMDRVSGWYKRRSQLILFVIALAIAGAFNADTFTIGQRLWKDNALRAAITAQANPTVSAGKAVCTAAPGNRASSNANPTSLDTVANCVAAVKQLALPIGWTELTSPKTGIQGITKAVGLLVTAFAIMLGAPFWFDFLGKAAQLRSAGSKPARASPS